MIQFTKYVGLDTHKDTIAVTIADAAGDKPRFYGEMANTVTAVSKLIRDVSPNGEVVSYCYEAGPCGYGIYHQIIDSGHDCSVVAPSPRVAGGLKRCKPDQKLSLAVLSSEGFDALQVYPRSVRFGPETARQIRNKAKDVNQDATGL